MHSSWLLTARSLPSGEESLSVGSLSRGVSVRGGLCPGGSLSRGVSVWGISVQGSLCPGGLCPEGSLSGEISVQGGLSGGSLPRGVSVRETPLRTDRQTPVKVLRYPKLRFWAIKIETRLHSSRMHTARALTVSPSMLCTGGGVCSQGVSALGGGLRHSSPEKSCLPWAELND